VFPLILFFGQRGTLPTGRVSAFDIEFQNIPRALLSSKNAPFIKNSEPVHGKLIGEMPNSSGGSMNRTFTCLTVLGMMLLADALCIKQTVDYRGLFDSSTIAILLTVEGIAAGIFIASGFSLIRKRFARQKKPVTRRPLAAAAQA
jgi:hypothetical protein